MSGNIVTNLNLTVTMMKLMLEFLKAIAYDGKTVVITDSGDNCGAGGIWAKYGCIKRIFKTKNIQENFICRH